MFKQWTEPHGETFGAEFCDACGADERLFSYEGEKLCEQCLWEWLVGVKCDCCFEQDVPLYEFQGEKWCLNCILLKTQE